jgi:hypothetical protein
MTQIKEEKRSKQAKRSPHLADGEIGHLETVLSLASRGYATTPIPAMDLAYWVSRVNQLDADFHLLPLQKNRMAALSRSLSSIASNAAASAPALSGVAT